MANLIAIIYPDEFRAAEVLATLRRLQGTFQINLADACCVTRDKEGKVELHQTFNVTTAGAVSGGICGTLVGLLLLNPLIGLAVGTAAGAVVGGLSDHGIPDDFMKQLAAKMAPGSSAIFLLIRMANMEKVEPEIARFGGHIIYTDLPRDAEAHLEKLLSESAAPSGTRRAPS
jgi:uncharacterized membrane protein